MDSDTRWNNGVEYDTKEMRLHLIRYGGHTMCGRTEDWAAAHPRAQTTIHQWEWNESTTHRCKSCLRAEAADDRRVMAEMRDLSEPLTDDTGCDI